jgi:DNA processing protein
MTGKETQYWVAFSLIPHIGRVKMAQMETFFSSLAEAWQAEPGALQQAGLDSSAITSIVSWRPRISPEAEMEKLSHAGVRALTYRDEDYPARLKEIYDYPPVLYVRGSLLPKDKWCLAVVGTRKATVYGKQVAEEIVTDLVRNKITIVSGLARGIDTVAHRAALEAGGRSIAVFATGLDSVYPAENANLAERVLQNGAVVSEYPLGTKPRPDYFPRRNRIMSGLCLGVLVVEADEASGAIITAHLALEQDREVFAIPGSILSPASRGTNRLIQEGAKLIRSYTDILEELNLTAVARQLEMKEAVPASDNESLLLQHLGTEPIHIDEVCRGSGLPIATVSSTMAVMEIKGLVKQVGNMNYILSRETRESYRVKVD